MSDYDTTSRLQIAREDLEQGKFALTNSNKVAQRIINDPSSPITVQITSDNGLIQEKGVFNLIAGVPYTITAQAVSEITNVTFTKDNGKQILIAFENKGDYLILTSAKTLVNLEYKFSGPRKTP